jgi:hypothetical protein
MKLATLKTLVVAAILVACAIPASAQSSASSIAFGIKGGGNLANFYGDAVGNVQAKLRAIGGAYLRFQFNDVLGFQPEVLYAQKGAKQSEVVDLGGTLGVLSGEWHYDYIEIPLLLDFSVPTETGMTPHFYAGPTISVLASAKAVADNGGEIDFKDYTKSTDFSLTVGGGINIGNGPVKFVLDLRYVMGLSTFDSAPLSDYLSRKNNTIAFMGGIQFGG